MHILISNDDGYFAEGIQVLYTALKDSPHSVTMVAPDRDNSACSSFITLREPVTVRRLEDSAYAISGTPTDCVCVAMGGLIKEPIDLVVSGINNGTNMGDDVLYSGTVAAALEARRLGLPNIALSVTERRPRHYQTAVSVLFDLLDKIETFPRSDEIAMLNVNVPDVPYDELKGLKTAALGARTAPVPHRTEITEKGVHNVWLGAAGHFDPEQHNDDLLYDFQAVELGYAAVTPIRGELLNKPYLEETASWLGS